MNTYDLLTVGNATIDAFLTLPEDSDYCRLDSSSQELRIAHGHKISLTGCEFHVGGNAANVAVGVTRGGYKTALMAELGEDEFAAKIRNTLTSEQVDLTHVQYKGESSFAVGLQLGADRTIFVEHHSRKHEFSFENIETSYIYLTSIGNEWENAYAKTVAYAQKTGVILALNPGTIQLHAGLDAIREVLKRADIVFVNKEETEELFGGDKKRIPELISALKTVTNGMVVMTNGADGAYGLSKEGATYHAKSLDYPIIEKTGAGDAFASGFLTGWMREKSMQKALQYASLNAACVIGKVGSQQGLVTEHEYKEKLQALPEVEQL